MKQDYQLKNKRIVDYSDKKKFYKNLRNNYKSQIKIRWILIFVLIIIIIFILIYFNLFSIKFLLFQFIDSFYKNQEICIPLKL